MNITTAVTNQVSQIPVGQPFLTKSLLGLGSRTAVDQVLSRLNESGAIARVTRGVYVRPKVSKLLGRSVMPSAFEVVEAIAEAEHAKVQVHGAEAARQLGLSTQVPAQVTFMTNGAAHCFTLGKLKVTMKQVAPKKLALAGSSAGLAHAALLYLGKHEVTHETLRRVEEAIGDEEFSALKEARGLLPGWLTDKLYTYELEKAVPA